ncbi:hypothetical protein GOP47_0022263, partial [Adiantum capillus-veneris]
KAADRERERERGLMGRLINLLMEPEVGGAGQQEASGLSGVSYYNGRIRAPPPSRLDTNILIVTSSLFAVLLLALCMHFTFRWALLHLCRISPRPADSAPPSAPALHIDSLPSTLYHPPADSARSTHATLAPICPICLSDFADGERIRVLPSCQHGFHVTCIDTWLAQHTSCPTCRGSLLEPVPVERHVCLHILITKGSRTSSR